MPSIGRMLKIAEQEVFPQSSLRSFFSIAVAWK